MKNISWNIYVLGEHKGPMELLREAGAIGGVNWCMMKVWDKGNCDHDDERIFGKTTYGSKTFYAAIFPYRMYRSNT